MSGHLIGGKYKIVQKLGEGLGGQVYLVETPNGERAALKQLQTRSGELNISSEEILDNFKQEFSLLKKLSHPHIVRILDFGYEPRGKFYYFTTEYIQGEDILQATRGLSSDQIESLFVEILRALSYLHSQRVFHFDIKPPNILIEKQPNGKRVAKLIDFGVSAFRKEGILAGTPGYLAPESLVDGRRDGRADLYSLGVTWYTCLTGKNPFEGESVPQTISLHRVWMPPPISDAVPSVPSYLDGILEKMLKKNPAERYHRADQIIRDLNWGGTHHYPLETEATALSYLPGEGRLIGRNSEWNQLLSLFERVFVSHTDPKCGVVIFGPPGSGKSRLLQELKYHAQLQTVPVLTGMEALQSKVTQDTLVLVDDADETAMTQLEKWMMLFHDHSLLIVVTGNLPSSSGLWQSMELKNFDRERVADYVSSILGVDNPPEFLIDELHKRTEGNPLLLNEILQSLIQSRQLFDEQGLWSATRLQDIGIDFQKLIVPKTVAEYCQNKFDRLTLSAQNILLVVSCAKAPLTRQDLTQISLDSDKETWKILRDENLVEVDASGFLRLLNPNFINWTPSQVSESTRSELHEALGQLFLKDPARKLFASYHLGLGTGSREQRHHNLLEYGELLLNQEHWTEAVHIFSLAEELAPTIEKKVEAKLDKVRSLFRAGRNAEALNHLEESRLILKRERENPNQWHWVQQTLRAMASLYLKEGRLDLARESLEASRVLLEEHAEEPAEEIILDNLKSSILMREGNLPEAQRMSESAYQRWKLLDPTQKKKALNHELGSILMSQGKNDEAKKIFQEQSEFSQSIGNLTRKAFALYGWAECCYALKEFDEAVRIFKECEATSREIKNEELLFCTFNGLGNIAYLKENWDQAAHDYENALDMAKNCANVEGSFAVAMNMALVYHLQGEQERSYLVMRRVIQTLEMLISPSLHQLQILIRGYLEFGQLAMEDSNLMEARDIYRDASRLARKYPSLESFLPSTLLGLCRASLGLGQEKEGHTILMELEKLKLNEEQRMELEKLKRRRQVPTVTLEVLH